MPEIGPGVVSAEEELQEFLSSHFGSVTPSRFGVIPGEDVEASLKLDLGELFSAINDEDAALLMDPRPEAREAVMGSFTSVTPVSQGGGPLNAHGEPPSISGIQKLDVLGKNLLSGLASGLIEPLEHLPFVGPRFVQPFLTPFKEALNQQALESVMETMAQIPGAEPSTMIRMLQTGGQLLGGITGIIVPFTAMLRLSRYLLAARRVTTGLGATGRAGTLIQRQPGRLIQAASGLTKKDLGLGLHPLSADVVGFFFYGAATKEPGLVQSILSGAHRGVGTHQEDFLQDIVDRGKIGLFSAAELGALSLVFGVTAGAFRMLRQKRAYFAGTRTAVSTEALIESQAPQLGGTNIRVERGRAALRGEEYAAGVESGGAVLGPNGEVIFRMPSSPGVAEEAMWLDASTEFMLRTPGARQAVVEGAQPVEAMFESLRKLPEAPGSFWVSGDVEDTFALVGRVRALASEQAEEATARVIIGKRAVTGLAHDSGEIARMVGEGEGRASFLVYGRGTGVREALSGKVANTPKGDGPLKEFVILPSSDATIERAGTWTEALRGKPLEHRLDDLVAQGKEVLVVGDEVLPLTDDILRSVRNVDDTRIADFLAKPQKLPQAGELIGFGAADAPAEVLLARRLPKMAIFQRPVPEREGLFQIMAAWKEAMPSRAVIDAWLRGEKYIEGMTVMYHGSPHTFLKMAKETEEGVLQAVIRKLEGGERTVGLDKLDAYVTGIPQNVDLAEGIVQKYANFIIREEGAEARQALGREGFRKQFRDMKNPGGVSNDVYFRGDNVLNIEELGLVEVASEDAFLTKGFKANEPHVVFSEPAPATGKDKALWDRFKVEADLTGLTEVESETMRIAAEARVRGVLYNKTPLRDRQLLEAAIGDTETAINKAFAEDELGTFAALQGWIRKLRPDGSVELEKVGTRLTYAFKTEQGAMRALKRMAGSNIQEEISSGYNYLGISVPGGVNGHLPGYVMPADRILDESLPGAMERIAAAHSEIGLPSAHLKGALRWTELVSEETGVPIFKGFDRVIVGLSRARSETAPFRAKAAKLVRGMSTKESEEVGRFYAGIEENPLTLSPAKLKEAMVKGGLNAKQQKLVKEMTELQNATFPIAQDTWGLAFEEGDHLWNYFSRVKPAFEGPNPAPWEAVRPFPRGSALDEAYASHTRSGELVTTERHPIAVFNRYINALQFDKHVRTSWNELNRIAGMRFGELTKEAQKTITTKTGIQRAADAPAFPQSMSTMLNEMLASMRGYAFEGKDFAVDAMRTVFRKMGIKISKRDMEEYFNIGISLQYGAAMAGRLRPISRNAMQNPWNMLPKVGEGPLGQAWHEVATDPSLWDRGRRAAWFKVEEHAVAGDERLFGLRDPSESLKAVGKGMWPPLLAAMTKATMAVGRQGARLGGFGLRFFGGSDGWNRMVAARAQEIYTEPWLRRLQLPPGHKQKITETQFRNKGLFTYGVEVENEFMSLLKTRGDTEALEYIGRQAANSTNYIYGLGAQPLMLQNTTGRLFGIFGTWPIWQKDLLLQNWKNTDAAGKMLMLSRYARVATATTGIGWAWGVNIHSWMGPIAPFEWFGGGLIDPLIATKELVEAPWAHKTVAARNLLRDLGSLAWPGKILYNDISGGLQAAGRSGDLRALAASFMFGRPNPTGTHLFLSMMRQTEPNQGIFGAPGQPGDPGQPPVQAISQLPR